MNIRKKGKFLSLVAILSIFSILLAACSSSSSSKEKASGDGTYTFKVAHVVQENHVWNKTAEKFGEELEKLSDGRMKLDIYPASQLGQEKDMVQQLETGSIDFGFLTNAYMSTRQDSLNSWFMPFEFNNLEEAIKLRDSEPTKEMLKELESQGLVGLDFAFAGNRHILMKDGFINSPADLKGKKVRIIGSPSIQKFWDETGAGPTAMPLSEVYTSLQTGVIDGIDIDLDALVTEKYYENAEYLTLTNHTTFPTVIVMGKSSYDKLSAEDQKIVKTALNTAVEWGLKEAIKREKTNLEELKKNGVKVQVLKDSSSFDAITKKVTDEYSEKSPVIKSFLETAK
ncbi:TRAP transporter substrate-binding protein [Peribacillus asahii]|uniref:Putative C4-dicarboxylate-binding periplasmic protein n=1 Tax=Peribacillus asahii TaxID=228899 RepID=A0A3Q9RM19_9BACI|nr:TRAP transporter substrate-binding protein [Peribacillus asahii]AZV44800.1 putative C4-dicarboxylate-binding periplasmic protein [Peribacillus asahii]USK84450.1 TRAP transporter substrate-binding protein [Peribacillus asahii]